MYGIDRHPCAVLHNAILELLLRHRFQVETHRIQIPVAVVFLHAVQDVVCTGLFQNLDGFSLKLLKLPPDISERHLPKRDHPVRRPMSPPDPPTIFHTAYLRPLRTSTTVVPAPKTDLISCISSPLGCRLA